jgi:DNA mismatch repair ATPase MutS
MHVDWQTLQDLGILKPEGFQASLFDWANFTRTTGGAHLLKERFRHPLSDIQPLRETQEAVAWLAGHAELFDSLLGGSAWLTIEHYVESPIVALDYPNRLFLWLDSWWMRRLHADLFREVSAALSMAQALSRQATAVAEALAPLPLPTLMESWRAALQECVDEPSLARLRTSREVHLLRAPRVLSLDRALRTRDFAPLTKLASLAYQIDALRSLALATRDHGLTFPDFLEDGPPRVEIEGLYHPLLDAPVGNPLHIHPDGRLVFLTGPNMAGKSTYLRAAGLAVYLAQIGMGVPARSCRITPFACLFSGINTTDNLRLGQSYFYREVRRVREVVDILAGGTPAFVLFDEMFKGTNLKDASDACLAVLSGFVGCETSAFVVASHIAELATGIEKLAGVQLLHFGAEVRNGTPVFEYRVSRGASEQRLGMLILEREGVLERLHQLGAATPPA